MTPPSTWDQIQRITIPRTIEPTASATAHAARWPRASGPGTPLQITATPTAQPMNPDTARSPAPISNEPRTATSAAPTAATAIGTPTATTSDRSVGRGTGAADAARLAGRER